MVMKALFLSRRIIAFGFALLAGSTAGSAVAWNHPRYAVIEIPQSSTTAASINNARTAK